MWHNGKIFKLKQSGLSGRLLRLLKDSLVNKLLNGQNFSWADIKAGLHRRFHSGTIIDLPGNSFSNPK